MANRPLLMEGCLEYLNAFNFLDGSRGMFAEGLQAITVAEVKAYCEMACIPMGEPALKLLRIVQRMDDARINHWHKKNSKP